MEENDGSNEPVVAEVSSAASQPVPASNSRDEYQRGYRRGFRDGVKSARSESVATPKPEDKKVDTPKAKKRSVVGRYL